MSSPELASPKKGVSFREKDLKPKDEAEKKSEDSPTTKAATPQTADNEQKDASKKKQEEKAPAEKQPSSGSSPASPEKKRSGESPVPLKKATAAEMESSILKKGATQKIKCHECGEWFTAEEWPNHKDGLRKVDIKKKTYSLLQKYVALPLVDFWMWFLSNVFFREIAVVGQENIPTEGPVVFYVNHQNQFIDAMVLRATTRRNCRFIVAEKSMHRPVVGHFARLMNAVPVVRPQDVPAVSGDGQLSSMEPNEEGDRNIIHGTSTKFTTLNSGDVIIWVDPTGHKCTAQILHVVSDTTVTVTQPIQESSRINTPTSYKYSKRIDQSEMYAVVYDTLGKGEAIAIFPEGGSHDHTSLQPLKAGVALFTLGAAERGIYTKMVPVGLNYFHGDRFRSRVHVEIGKPILPPEDLIQQFSVDKRTATGELLTILNDHLRAVTINVEDWPSLKFLHSFRRLYQPPNAILDNATYLRLTRRLSLILNEYGEEPEFQDFRSKTENYMDYCNALLISEAQAATLANLKQDNISWSLLGRRLVLLFIFGVVLLPFALVSLPIGLIARSLSDSHSRMALAQSSVKVVGADVKASYKIISCFALIPVVITSISAFVWWYSDIRTAVTVLASLPMMMYVSLLISQEFVMEVRAALPLLMSIMSKHKQFLKLHERREKLVRLAHEIVQKYDSALGAELQTLLHDDNKADLRQPSLFSLRGQRLQKKKMLAISGELSGSRKDKKD